MLAGRPGQYLGAGLRSGTGGDGQCCQMGGRVEPGLFACNVGSDVTQALLASSRVETSRERGSGAVASDIGHGKVGNSNG